MLIYRNAARVHGQRKVGRPCARHRMDLIERQLFKTCVEAPLRCVLAFAFANEPFKRLAPLIFAELETVVKTDRTRFFYLGLYGFDRRLPRKFSSFWFPSRLQNRGGERVYYHGPHEFVENHWRTAKINFISKLYLYLPKLCQGARDSSWLNCMSVSLRRNLLF